MNKLSLVLSGMVLGGTMLAAPVASASNGEWRGFERACANIDQRQDRLFGRFDQENTHLNQRIQRSLDRENRRDCPQSADIVDTLVANGNFKTLTAAVGAAGLVDTLKGGEFTVFAPTDQAFAKLPAGTVEALLADIPKLTSILTYHVVSGTVPASVASTLTSAPTVNGKAVAISHRDGSLYINDSRVVVYDIPTANGVIHVIDTVLLP